MVKQILPAIVIMSFLSSCSSLKPLNFSNNKQTSSVAPSKSQARFIEDITMTPQVAADKAEIRHESTTSRRGYSYSEAQLDKQAESRAVSEILAARTPEIEKASSVQLKYAVLLNTEVESLPSKALLENVDEWYGVRYVKGGNTKKGVDCSGLTTAVYSAVYGFVLPRVSREQYRISRKISTTELEEGDLVFFNTNGSGVSHVGVYLGNSKFIHASVSKGVMVNSLFESYYLKRFIGGGRIEEKETVHN